MKKSELIKLIENKVRKVLNEYLINKKSKVKDVLELNVFEDCYTENKLSKFWEDYDYGTPEDKHKWLMKVENKYNKITKDLDNKLKKYYNKPIPKDSVEELDDSWYDGSDVYDSIDYMIKELPGIYDTQIEAVENLIANLEEEL